MWVRRRRQHEPQKGEKLKREAVKDEFLPRSVLHKSSLCFYLLLHLTALPIDSSDVKIYVSERS